jgi:hypothetical protein
VAILARIDQAIAEAVQFTGEAATPAELTKRMELLAMLEHVQQCVESDIDAE